MTSASAAAKLALKTTKRPRPCCVTPSATWARSTGGAKTSRPAHEPRRNEAGEEGQDDARPDRVPGDALLAPEWHHVGAAEHEPGDGRVEQEIEPRGAHALLEEEVAALCLGHGRPYSVSSRVDVHAARQKPAPRRRPGGRARGPRRGATAAAPLPARRRPRARPAAGDGRARGRVRRLGAARRAAVPPLARLPGPSPRRAPRPPPRP